MNIIKRNGQISHLDVSKIENAILRAGVATSSYAEIESKRIAEIVENMIRKLSDSEIEVKKVQNIVEQCIMAAGHYDAAKAYIIYRQKRDELRDIKKQMGIDDPLKLTLNQVKVLVARHIRKDADGKPTESTSQLFERVARAISDIDKKYNLPASQIEEYYNQYYSMMTSMKFIPGGSYLRNAGFGKPLNNCHVLPIEDSIEQIYETVKNSAILTKTAGGGVGYNFSKIRPNGSYISASGGLSTGPLSFMEIIDTSTLVISRGGYKKGANMGVLNVDHPDIIDFIKYKKETNGLTTFNVSVGLTDEFISNVKNNQSHKLKDPKTGRVVSEINASDLFDFICRNAHDNGDPGALFLDNANKTNQVPGLGRLESTNICGEIWLFPYDVCNLGSINLNKFVKDGLFDFEELEEITKLATRFMDCGVDLSDYSVKKVTEMALANRRIGLGIMGLADVLIELELPYDSEEARMLAAKIMKTINSTAFEASKQLGIEKGNFKHYDLSIYKNQGIPMRNCARTAVAPNGSISMVANASSGCEPLFALAFKKNVVDSGGLFYLSTAFEKIAKKYGFNTDEVYEKVSRTGSVEGIEDVPSHIQEVLKTAGEIDYKGHIKMQAALQSYTDNSISKTINMPNSATVDDVKNAYLMAHSMGCKGITIYRDGSRTMQVLSKGSDNKKQDNTQVIQSKIKVTPLSQRSFAIE